VVVLSGNSASITEAYALIKKVSHAFARRHFRILVNKVRSQPDARSIYENIAQVAAQRGIARLEYAGAIPPTNRCARLPAWSAGSGSGSGLAGRRCLPRYRSRSALLAGQ
jgi:MinD-like ATPase involved in chromosome partitioning or flagellar assembly